MKSFKPESSPQSQSLLLAESASHGQGCAQFAEGVLSVETEVIEFPRVDWSMRELLNRQYHKHIRGLAGVKSKQNSILSFATYNACDATL